MVFSKRVRKSLFIVMGKQKGVKTRQLGSFNKEENINDVIPMTMLQNSSIRHCQCNN